MIDTVPFLMPIILTGTRRGYTLVVTMLMSSYIVKTIRTMSRGDTVPHLRARL